MKRKVLVVDDDARYLELLDARLQLVPRVETSYATTAVKAIELLQSGAFDLMITDLEMPGIDGIELAEIARGLATGMETVLVTGNSSPAARKRAAAAGISRVLIKPCRWEQLLDLITTDPSTRETESPRTEGSRPC